MTNKGLIQNFFEDFEVGRKLTCPTPRVLTDADRVAYISFTGDRTPLYCSSAGSVHPLIVFHTVLGQTVRQISLNAVANLGYAEMVWHRPVRVGDEIHTTIEIIGLKENSNRQSGIVYARTTGSNQHGEPVLSYCRWVMVRKNREAETSYLRDPVVPTVAPLVPTGHLAGTPPNHFSPRDTGGNFFLEDYSVGERIYHSDGQTINSSDHMSFTRLYQNSARVHFDAITTGGKPLVYGGLIISLGYAQAFSGFENRLGIKAINAGTHANPAYAGDTAYCFTEVLDRVSLSDLHGALRLRMFVVKNHQPDESFSPMNDSTSSNTQRYHPAVVLDLDYWELMATRRSDAGRR